MRISQSEPVNGWTAQQRGFAARVLAALGVACPFLVCGVLDKWPHRPLVGLGLGQLLIGIWILVAYSRQRRKRHAIWGAFLMIGVAAGVEWLDVSAVPSRLYAIESLSLFLTCSLIAVGTARTILKRRTYYLVLTGVTFTHYLLLVSARVLRAFDDTGRIPTFAGLPNQCAALAACLVVCGFVCLWDHRRGLWVTAFAVAFLWGSAALDVKNPTYFTLDSAMGSIGENNHFTLKLFLTCIIAIPLLWIGAAFDSWNAANDDEGDPETHPHCHCGYSLRGNLSGICPECGVGCFEAGERVQ